ncbi:hypothetical protein ACWCXE_06070 [Streptomyces sp. NPDC001780]
MSAAGQQLIKSVLLSVHEQDRLLDEFAVRCFLAFEFGEESEVTRQLLIDTSDGHPRLTLHHSFRIVDWEKSQEHSELNFDVALTFTDVDCTVEASVMALLEWQMGEFGVGTHTLYRAFDSHVPLDDALPILAERVAQLCALDDVPGRLGLRRS